MGQQGTVNILVIWRGMQLNVEVNQASKVHELGDKLQKLTNVKPDTLKLLVPQSRNKSSRLISPFSDEYSSLTLLEASIFEGKPVRMMGAFDNEVKEVSDMRKSDMRILGFDEEEKRLRQRSLNNPQPSLKLPQGPYIFCDFRTLQLPGVELHPPPSEALRRMHMLACDPGIIAIMNKHQWRVGLMSEMAPEGYVGISPKCLLGFNKNQGEEISLRLRTDDLKGFRKYESIKKTLLHELAHMVHSDHDASFRALDKQLNEEAASLDWTKSTSHTLGGRKVSHHYEEESYLADSAVSSSSAGRKLGGASQSFPSARASSVAAAYSRLLTASYEAPNASDRNHLSNATEPDPDAGELKGVPELIIAELEPEDTLMTENYSISHPEPSADEEPDPDASLEKDDQIKLEPDLYESVTPIGVCSDKLEAAKIAGSSAEDTEFDMVDAISRTFSEPDPDLSMSDPTMTGVKLTKSDPHDSSEITTSSNNSLSDDSVKSDPEPKSDMNGLQRIEEPVAAVCSCIQRATEMLRSEATAAGARSVLEMLVKIIRNVIEHPGEMKFKRLRKSNPQIQRNILNYKAAMDVLSIVGFCEDSTPDEFGRVEAYLVLKRNDPGLLWLAKSSLEVSMT